MPSLYMAHGSPPSRAALVCSKALGLNLEIKEVDVLTGEHRKPEYLKINPQHTVPVFVDDDGFTLADSHAIMAYLVSKYGKNDDLYPKDIKKRAIIDQRLHFDTGVMFVRMGKVVLSLWKEGKTSIGEDIKADLHEAYGFLESFLQGHQFVAGSLSIADYSLITTLSSIAGLVPVDPAKFPNVTAWVKRMEALPEYEFNKKGQAMLEGFLKSKLA